MKLHQMYSGTVKFESGKSTILDLSKAEFIRKQFFGMKIGIFYKFKEELKALKEVYGDDLCTELDDFNATNKSIALQIVSGREGISLRKAKALVYYNIDWVFSRGGIEKQIYRAVTKKKDYTLRHFKKDLMSL